jgi:hypothetical protein
MAGTVRPWRRRIPILTHPVPGKDLSTNYSKLIRTPINRKASCRASADSPKERGDEASGSEKVKLTMPSGRTYAAGIWNDTSWASGVVKRHRATALPLAETSTRWSCPA